MDSPAAASSSKGNPIVDFFAVPFRPRTYGNLLYLWLGFPLGLAYFVALTVGFATGIPLTLVWVGLLVLLATFALAWAAGGLERQLAIRLLGASVPERLVPGAVPDARRFAKLREVGSSAALWKGIVFLFLKFPLGLASWVISLVALVVPIAFIGAPFALLFEHGNIDFGWWDPDTFVEALPLSFAGLLALFVALHLHNALGWVWARLAEWLLGASLPPAASDAAISGAAPSAA